MPDRGLKTVSQPQPPSRLRDVHQRKPVHVIEATRHTSLLDLKTLRKYRDVGLMMALRSIKIRYKQTIVGLSWAILQPILAMIVFSVVFGRFVGVDSEGVSYPLFAYVGLLAWGLFSSIVSGAASSLVDNALIITKVYFPRVLLPGSVLGYASMDFVAASLVLPVLMMWYRHPPGHEVLFLPIVVVGILACSLGLGLFLSALYVKYRDLRFVLPFLLQIWMLATPVIYPYSVVPSQYRLVASLNPMVGLVSGFRWCVLGTPLDSRAFLLSYGVSLVMAWGGLRYFAKAEDDFADIV